MSANREVEAYELSYHPQQGCAYRIKVKGNPQWIPLKCSPSDLAAVAAILKEQPVFITNGWLHTGPEPIDGI